MSDHSDMRVKQGRAFVPRPRGEGLGVRESIVGHATETMPWGDLRYLTFHINTLRKCLSIINSVKFDKICPFSFGMCGPRGIATQLTRRNPKFESRNRRKSE